MNRFELLKKVFEKWQHSCACDLGFSIIDCPGPPTKKLIEVIKEWMKDPSQPIDIYPFSDPDLWETYLCD